MARGGERYESMVGREKARLFQDLEGTLVEIGSGTGPNLRYLPPGIRVVGVEPNPYMHGHYLDQARKEGRRVHLVRGLAQSLPFPDESVETVLSTLVLCSVEPLAVVLDEIIRILKPGGRLLFVEHVAAPEGSWLRRIQRGVKPVWRWAGDGCEPDRETGRHLRSAGFSLVSFQRFTLPLPLVGPHIAGIARK